MLTFACTCPKYIYHKLINWNGFETVLIFIFDENMNQKKKPGSKTTNQVHFSGIWNEPPRKQSREQDALNFSQMSQLNSSYAIISKYKKEQQQELESRSNGLYRKTTNNSSPKSPFKNTREPKKYARVTFDDNSNKSGLSLLQQLQAELNNETPGVWEMNAQYPVSRSNYKHSNGPYDYSKSPSPSPKMGRNNGGSHKSPLRNNLILSIPQSLNSSLHEFDLRKGIQTHGFNSPIRSPSDSFTKENLQVHNSRNASPHGNNGGRMGISSNYYNGAAPELVERGVQRLGRNIPLTDPRLNGRNVNFHNIIPKGEIIRNAFSPIRDSEKQQRTVKNPNSASVSRPPSIERSQDKILDDLAMNEAEKDSKIASLNAEILHLQLQAAAEKEEREHQFKQLFAEIEKLKPGNSLTKLPSTTEKLEDLLNHTETKANNDKSDVTALNLRISELENELDEQKRLNSEHQEKLKKINSEMLSQTQVLFEGLLKEAAQRERGLREELKKLQNTKKQYEELIQNHKELEEICLKQKGEIESLTSLLKETHKKAETTKNELSRVDQNYKYSYAAKSSEIEKLKKKLTESENKVNLLNTEVTHLKSDLENARLKNKHLFTQLDEVEAENRALIEKVRLFRAQRGDISEDKQKITRSQSKLLPRRFSEVMSILDQQKSVSGRFRLKNLEDALANLRLVMNTFEGLTWELGEGIRKKFIAVKDRLREGVSQLEIEMQFIYNNIDKTENFESKMARFGGGSREKSPTFGTGVSESTAPTTKKKLSSTNFGLYSRPGSITDIDNNQET